MTGTPIFSTLQPPVQLPPGPVCLEQGWSRFSPATLGGELPTARPCTEYLVLFGFAFFLATLLQGLMAGDPPSESPPERAEYVNIGKIVL